MKINTVEFTVSPADDRRIRLLVNVTAGYVWRIGLGRGHRRCPLPPTSVSFFLAETTTTKRY